MKNCVKNEKGITLMYLVIVIIIMFILAGTTTQYSLDRFDMNKLKRMQTDISLLNDKILNYYLKYNSFPLLEDLNNNSIKYTYSETEDSGEYYVINLAAMSGISLNYGKDGFDVINKWINEGTEEPSQVENIDDIYVFDINTYSVYYVRGITVQDVKYHKVNEENIGYNLGHLTSPSIDIVEGEKNDDEKYVSSVILEFIPGIHKTETVTTTCVINKLIEDTESVEQVLLNCDIVDLENNLYEINQTGVFKITIISTIDEDESKQEEMTITIIQDETETQMNNNLSNTL